MRRNHRAVLATALMLGLAGCAEESPDVQIGVIVSLDGIAAAYGNSIKNGLELAVDELNAQGGINVNNTTLKPVTMLLRDCKSDPELGIQMATELIEAGVPAVIGADASHVTLAIAPLFQEAQVLLLSPATSTPKLTQAGDFIYRNFPSDELEALNTADHIYNKEHIQEVAVIANQEEYGLGITRAFIERFRMLGGRVEDQVSYPPDATDFSQQVAELAASEPPAIYIAGYSSDTAAVATAIREAGLDVALFATGAVLPDDVIQRAPEASEGLVYPQPDFDASSDAAHISAFVSAYRERFGRTPDVYAAHAYDAMGILAQAIQESGTSPMEIRFYLDSMNPYEGVAGSTNFNENGDVRKFHRMYRISNGAAAPVEAQ